jgi:hypothetical protein
MRGNDDQKHRRGERTRRVCPPVTTSVLGRTTTWLLAVWSGYIAAWAAVSGSSPIVVVVWWLAGVGLVQAIARSTGRPQTTDGEPTTSTSTAHTLGVHLHEAVQDWESEGGAIA